MFLYNDNRAAVVLAAGTGGGWRTRHLRIRAHCLAEAIKMGESSLNHRPGSSLWADALTKSLPPQSLERFCQGVFLCQAHQSSEAKKKVLERGESGGVSRCMAMMLAGVSLLPVGQASEVCEKGESDHEQKSGTFGDLGWLIFLAGLVCLLHLIKDIGFGMIQRLLSGREEVKVKLLTEEAVMPVRGSEGAVGWDMCTTMPCSLQPGERRLLSTGIALELPKGSYGRIASRSSLAAQGLDVAGGVVDPDYRGEIKIIMVNHSDTPKAFEVGDRVAQLIVEKASTAPMVRSNELSNTSRGGGGFGSSGVSVKKMRAHAGCRSEGELPEEGLHDCGSPGHEGLAGAGEGLPDRGSPGHEGTGGVLSHRGPPGHVSSASGSAGLLPVRESGRVMENRTSRLREAELRPFSWLLADSVLRFVENLPMNGIPHEVMVQFPRTVIFIKIHRHGALRKKLFDSDLSVPPASSGVASCVVTLAWLEDGRKVIRTDARKGSHGMHFLHQRWTGYSLLFRVSELSEHEGSAETGSC